MNELKQILRKNFATFNWYNIESLNRNCVSCEGCPISNQSTKDWFTLHNYGTCSERTRKILNLDYIIRCSDRVELMHQWSMTNQNLMNTE